MKCHRVNEVIELLQQHWLLNPDLNLIEFLTQLAAEAGCNDSLANLSDEVLIYQLKMRDKDQHAPIPGLQKDYEDDFKSALLKARGVSTKV